MGFPGGPFCMGIIRAVRADYFYIGIKNTGGEYE